MRFLKFILTFALFTFAFAGDYVVFRSKYSSSLTFRAISDSIVHGAIGFLSAALFFSYKLNISIEACLAYSMFCTLMSSAIDIDHVFVAKSIHLQDLTGLTQRGIFHCTTFWTLLTTFLLIYSYIVKNLKLYILSYMIILAFTSHHIRDGNRRGLWIYPFGHTAPINKYVYAMLLGLLPNVFVYLYVYFKRDFILDVVEYITV